jgi:N-acetylmuramoyl-L-alanine amidase
MVRNLLITCIVLLILPLQWAQAELLATAKNGQETLKLNLPGAVYEKVFFMAEPPRLVIDIRGLKERPSLTLPKIYKGKLFKDVRTAWFNTETIRVVIELTKPTQLVSKQSKKGSLTLVLGSQVQAATTKEKPLKVAKATVEAKEPAEAPLPAKKKEKPLIAIDAGHGGEDPGAIGSGGVQEKHITLRFARDLKEEILKRGEYRVLLTREDDRFILLRERVAIARRAGASLFISLHADSAPESMQGNE